ncbi:MAG: hypothetical protein NT135_02870 [Candidatus Berkelbacteria bacterium]|nr:hypothetical protein [Candidatus Berkelbacteria bacterium]
MSDDTLQTILKQIDQHFIIGAIVGLAIGFLYTKITGKLIRWVIVIAIVVAIGYYYIKSKS